MIQQTYVIKNEEGKYFTLKRSYWNDVHSYGWTDNLQDAECKEEWFMELKEDESKVPAKITNGIIELL